MEFNNKSVVGKQYVAINQVVDVCSVGGEIESLILALKVHFPCGGRKTFLSELKISNTLYLGKSSGNVCSEEHYRCWETIGFYQSTAIWMWTAFREALDIFLSFTDTDVN